MRRWHQHTSTSSNVVVSASARARTLLLSLPRNLPANVYTVDTVIQLVQSRVRVRFFFFANALTVQMNSYSASCCIDVVVHESKLLDHIQVHQYSKDGTNIEQSDSA